MAKFDASQFFKDADINRGAQRIAELLERVNKQKRAPAVAFYRSNRMQGNLCSSRRRDEQHVKIVRFKTILSTI